MQRWGYLNDVFGTFAIFALVAAIGYLIYILSAKVRMPPIIPLLAIGFICGSLLRGLSLAPISQEMIFTIAVISLIIIVFNDTSKFEVQSVNHFSVAASRLSLTFVFINIVFMVFFISLFFFGGFDIWNILYASIFALIIAGTDTAGIFPLFKNKANKVFEIIESEGTLNTPITVLLPVFLIDVISKNLLNFNSDLWQYVGSLLLSVVISIGVGIVIGILFFRAVRTITHEKPNYFIIIVGALVSFVAGEMLGGSGILSVGILGLVFGNIYLKDRDFLHGFNDLVSNSLEIIVVLLAGFVIDIPFNAWFIAKTLVIFFVLVISRYISILIAMPSTHLNKSERTLLAIMMPKGISVAALVLFISTFQIPELNLISSIIVMVMLYSILSSIAVLGWRHRYETMD